MHCRHHASQLRRDEEHIMGLGADIVAVGTGDARYARAFIDDEQFPYLVLLDEDGEAADVASLKRGKAAALVGPKAMRSALSAYAKGHRQKLKLGRRPTQLGATFVIGPGDVVRYQHIDDHVGDHAPLEEIVGALSS
ncbi:MAG: AhpC/TSA family protein [Actinomycetota bacterium]|nr:AhpC/TSA family protein [Actinomycetota bacterium]